MSKGSNNPDPGKYADERYNPTLPHCGSLKISFDGSKLTLSGASKSYSFPAVSGKPDNKGRFDYNPARQTQANIGPIPEGVYWIRPDELWENAWWRIGASDAAWGEYRISIHPFMKTETHKRGGFFIHGGTVPGSAGCIDLTTKISDFIKALRAGLGSQRTCQIHVTVDYP